MPARIAAITMVRNGERFLRKWTAWYGSQLGRDNLFILFDGQDQVPPPCTEGCTVKVMPRVEGNVARADRGRIDIISEFAAGLLESYDFVIGTDVDEFICADPALGMTLAEYLSSLPDAGYSSWSPLGCDVVQRLGVEEPLDWDRTILSQRSHALLSTRYTKASILCKPVGWGSGFHRVRKGNFHILKDLYLFHMGCADAGEVSAKFSDRDLASRGWSRHLGKRERLFATVAQLPVRDWDAWTRRARRLQTLIRPPYAWNKPAMLGLTILVRIPDRFSQLF